jgi:hypothetical protein
MGSRTLIPKPKRRIDGRGYPWKSRRSVLNRILWVLRTVLVLELLGIYIRQDVRDLSSPRHVGMLRIV